MEKLCHFLGEITCKKKNPSHSQITMEGGKTRECSSHETQKGHHTQTLPEKEILRIYSRKSKNINFKSHEKMGFVWAFKNVVDE